MESIFSKQNNKKYVQISISQSLANELRKLNKGSYNKTIIFLLDNNADEKIKKQLSIMENRITELSLLIEKIVLANKLRTY